MSANQQASDYFEMSARAFEVIVRLGGDSPTDYDKDDVRNKIDRYAAVTSLGDVHLEAFDDIKGLIKGYKGGIEEYPDIKGYGIVGQYGDGKTHFLTILNQLLREESDMVHPSDMNLLTIDPFQFTDNPADIVRALRERVRVELGDEAASLIPDIASDDREEFRQRLKNAGIEDISLEDYDITKKDGKSAGSAFATGVKDLVSHYEIDAVVMSIDEIESISSGSSPSYEALDTYREFFDLVQPDVPVILVMTSPPDQWSSFKDIHDGFMARAFGPEPRQYTRLRTLNEQELKNTWTARRNNHLLHSDADLPPKYHESESFPMHEATLRAINACSKRVQSNRTAITLMRVAFQDFLEGELRWIQPHEALTEAAGKGDLFDMEQYENLLNSDRDKVLLNIAATLEQRIDRDELVELSGISEEMLDEHLDHFMEQGWIGEYQKSDVIQYQLTEDTLRSLLEDEDENGGPAGTIAPTVEKVMAGVPSDDEILYRNLARIIDDYIQMPVVDAGLDEHGIVIEDNFGNFYDRRLVILTEPCSPERIEEIRRSVGAELVLVFEHGDFTHEDDRVLTSPHEPWDRTWEYEIEGLDYSLHNWVCAYTRLIDELPSGANQLLNGLRNRIATNALDLDSYDLRTEGGDRLASIYPDYPKPVSQINSNAKTAYINLLETGKVGGALDWEAIKPQAPAQGQQSIEGYMQDWEDFDLADVNYDSTVTAEIKTSRSEELILEVLSGQDELALSSLYDQLENRGYTRDDVDFFLNILQTRGKIRREDGHVSETKQNVYLVNEYFQTVQLVAEWLTADEFPEEFKAQAIQNRDEIVGYLSTCRELQESLETGQSEEGINPVTRFADRIDELRDACVTAIESFDSSTFAQQLLEVQQEIDELEQGEPGDNQQSDDYYGQVQDLSHRAASFAGSAEARIHQDLQPEGDKLNVFEQLQRVHDEFAAEFREVGLYAKYNTEEEFDELREDFNSERPDVDDVRKAVTTVTGLSEKIGYAKEVVQIGHGIRKNLLQLEEISLEAYRTDSDISLAEDAEEVIDRFQAAEKTNTELTKTINSLGFRELDNEKLPELRNEKSEADQSLTDLERVRDHIDEEIQDRTNEILSRTSDTVERVTSVTTDEHHEIITDIQYPDIREDARVWYQTYEEVAQEISDRGGTVQGRKIPNTIDELVEVEQAYEEFEEELRRVPELRDQLGEITEDYFIRAEEDLPSGIRDQLDPTSTQQNPGNPTEAILKSLELIKEISDAVQLTFPPIQERIMTEVASRESPIPVTELVKEVPQPELNETTAEVTSILNSLIVDGELTLEFSDTVVVVD